MKRIAVFASGTGSNFKAIHQNILNGLIPAELACFVCDHPDAQSANYARDHRIDSFIFEPSTYKHKNDYELEILAYLNRHQVDLVVLAGYMRIIGQTLLHAYPNQIINIHPSLLPLYRGKDAIKRAWDHCEEKTGVTIHFVDEAVDHGKIILQEELIIDHASIDELTEAIHLIEHRLYTQAICLLLEDTHEKGSH